MAEEVQAEFNIQRIYLKDISFEAPRSPSSFAPEDWKPEINLDLNTKSRKVSDKVHEVILHLTVTVKVGEETAFLVEVQQAGEFGIDNVPEEQLSHMLGAFCPNIIFPYARETISDVVTRGGFPQLLLAPVNFDALYMQHMQRQQEQAEAATKN